jgi:hypothetical protein
MIEIHCNCAAPAAVPESMVGQSVTCPTCGQVTHIVAGEPLNMGAGVADFDAALVADGDGTTATTKYLLGGTVDIQIGKLPDRHIVLTGPLVSRQHCRLVRVDFGPSCWKIVDTKSRNGVLVNLHRVAEHDLQDGDIVQIGESVFTYTVARPMAVVSPAAMASQPARAAVAAVPDMPMGRPPRGLPTIGISAPRGPALPAPVCPSCDKTLAPGAKICVDCGIKIKDGRPLLTSLGGDENRLAETARAWIQLISLVIRVTPMPIPLRSEAYGEHRPYAIWTIAILTTIVSIGFFCFTTSADADHTGPPPGANLMLWSPWAGPPELSSAMMKGSATWLVACRAMTATNCDRNLILRATCLTTIWCAWRFRSCWRGGAESFTGTNWSPTRFCTTIPRSLLWRCTWAGTCCFCWCLARASIRCWGTSLR